MNNYEFMKSRPRRNCRGETLIRLLNATSYSKSFFSNLCVLFIEAIEGTNDESLLIETSNELRNLEKSYSMLDFARNIEIIRTRDQLDLNLKTLKFDPTANSIDDSKSNLNTLVNFNLFIENFNNNLISTITEEILLNFYLSQRRVKIKDYNLTETSWLLHKGNYNEEVKFNNVTTMINDLLSNESFNITIAQKSIILDDLNLNVSVSEILDY